MAPHLFPQLPQLFLSVVGSTQTLLQHLALEHCTSFEHGLVFESLLVHWLVLVLQYWLEPQSCGVPATPEPDPLQAEGTTAVHSVLHWSGQGVSPPGKTQPACEPSQYVVPQVPLPLQPVRGVVVIRHCPGTWLHL